MKECPNKFELIVTIVNKGFAEDVVDAAKEAGAEGGTILKGRGTGIHENGKLFGMTIEPEKEIILSAVNLDKPHTGIAFVLDVEKTIGICHLTK